MKLLSSASAKGLVEKNFDWWFFIKLLNDSNEICWIWNIFSSSTITKFGDDDAFFGIWGELKFLKLYS